jgi:phage terminase large subunit GpA-like protein
MISDSLLQTIKDGLNAAIPEGNLTISAWAEKYRFLPPERAASPGPWRNDKTPYLIEIMDAILAPECKEIVANRWN